MTKSPLFSFTLFFPYLEERRKKKSSKSICDTSTTHVQPFFFFSVCVRAFFLSAKFQREDQEVREEGKENERACFGVSWSRSTGTGKEHSSLGCYYCFPSLHASQKKKKKKRKHLITEQKQLKRKCVCLEAVHTQCGRWTKHALLAWDWQLISHALAHRRKADDPTHGAMVRTC